MFSTRYPSSLQQHSNEDRGSGAYARYGGRRGRERVGRGSIPSKECSEYRDRTQSITTLESKENIALSDSEKYENGKYQVTGMMKDLRRTIMIDVQEIMNENMKVLMKEMAVSISNIEHKQQSKKQLT